MLACISMHLYGGCSAQPDYLVTGFPCQTCREAAHALQSGSDIGQEGAQHPLQVDLGTALHGLQADAAQRVAAHTEVKEGFIHFTHFYFIFLLFLT